MTKNYLEIFNALRKFRDTYSDSKPFTLDDTGVSHRLITYWDQKNLLPTSVESQKWRKFSIVELTWIRLIAQLRQLNVGLRTMAILKADLFSEMKLIELIAANNQIQDVVKQILEEIDSHTDFSFMNTKEFKEDFEKQSFSTLSLFIQKIYAENDSTTILIGLDQNESISDSSGNYNNISVLYYNPNKLTVFLKREEFRNVFFGTHISISINELLSDVFLNASPVKLSNLIELTLQEKQMFDYIRSQKYCEITIRFGQDKEPCLIELTEERRNQTTSQMLDVIHNKSYQDINIKTSDGVVSYFTNTRKIKPIK